MNTYTFSFSKITIIGITDLNKLRIGVAKCGKKEKYNESLGIEIATNRATIQPYAIVPSASESEFLDYICPVIYDNIQRSKQWEPRLPRINEKL